MNLNFTLDDFLNDFASGFVFVFLLIITNEAQLTNYAFIKIFIDLGAFSIFLLFIPTFIIGLILGAITNYLEQDFYMFFDKLIRKIKIKVINKPIYWLKMATIHLFFRRWAVIETIGVLSKKKEEVLSDSLKFVAGKTPEEIYIIEKKLKREGAAPIGMHYWFKAQFCQICGNAILFVLILNIALFNSINIFSIHTIIYLFIIFAIKSMSPMFAKMFLRQLSREINALKINEVE